MREITMTLEPDDAALAIRELRRAARMWAGSASAERLRQIADRLETGLQTAQADDAAHTRGSNNAS